LSFNGSTVGDGAPLQLNDICGLPIGIIDEAEFQDDSVQPRRGDRICLASDGVIEQFQHLQREQFGMPRLSDRLTRRPNEPVNDAVQGIIASLTAWAGGPSFTDDVSLVLVDRVGD